MDWTKGDLVSLFLIENIENNADVKEEIPDVAPETIINEEIINITYLETTEHGN